MTNVKKKWFKSGRAFRAVDIEMNIKDGEEFWVSEEKFLESRSLKSAEKSGWIVGIVKEEEVVRPNVGVEVPKVNIDDFKSKKKKEKISEEDKIEE